MLYALVAAAHAHPADAPHIHAPDAVSFAIIGFWVVVALGWMSQVGRAGTARQGATSG